MTVERIKQVMVSVLIEAASTDGPIPRSTIYMMVGMDLPLADQIQGLMVEQGWIRATAETIVATTAGRKLVADCIEESGVKK